MYWFYLSCRLRFMPSTGTGVWRSPENHQAHCCLNENPGVEAKRDLYFCLRSCWGSTRETLRRHYWFWTYQPVHQNKKGCSFNISWFNTRQSAEKRKRKRMELSQSSRLSGPSTPMVGFWKFPLNPPDHCYFLWVLYIRHALIEVTMSHPDCEGMGTCSYLSLSVLSALGHAVLEAERMQKQPHSACMFIHKTEFTAYNLKQFSKHKIKIGNRKGGKTKHLCSHFLWDFLILLPFVILLRRATLSVKWKPCTFFQHEGTQCRQR